MRRTSLFALGASPVLASLPYNPTRVISTNNGSCAYVFAPQSSTQFSLAILDTANQVNAASPPLQTLFPILPFLSSSEQKAFIPLVDDEGNIEVLAGDCTDTAQGLELWRFTVGSDRIGGTWSQSQITLDDSSLSADYLSAGFTFSPTNSTGDASVYVFGGMCPDSDSTRSDWTSQASYSNTMLEISTGTSSQGPLDVSMTGARAPPIAEAGLSITALIPTYSNMSGNVSVQQNFVLLGGHTQQAFINMSQVALFSLPEESWAFLAIDQPGSDATTELAVRTVQTVEPRSGHSAVLTDDGTKIIVFGGWVGDISTPATPQMAVLETGQGYGGSGNWAWVIPSEGAALLIGTSGLYGHGATMLPGGVMMISGGYSISSGTTKRATQTVSEKYMFFNTTSFTWISSYTNPASPLSPAYTDTRDASGPLQSNAQKAGLGVGLGLGTAALIGLIIVWYWYSRRLRLKRSIREKELREMALGAERYYNTDVGRGGAYPEMRTASWGSRQERRIGNPDEDYPWAPEMSEHEAGRMRLRDDEDDQAYRDAERSGLLLDLPSPTRGLRRSLMARGPPAALGPPVGGAPSTVFRIEEEEEGSQPGSLKRPRSPIKKTDALGSNRYSDPFRDPSSRGQDSYDPAAAQRRKEQQSWQDDWSAAAERMRFPEHHRQIGTDRTYSNLSEYQSASNSGGNTNSSGRGSPDKSDRTGSNLSEQSMFSNNSIQRSIAGTVSRTISQRSASAGYALFAGAAAAVARATGTPQPRVSPTRESYGTVNTGKGALSHSPSKRSASLNLNSVGSSARGHGRKRSETFSTARTSIGPIIPGEDQALLSRMSTRAVDDWATPPESPVKQYASHNYEYNRTSSLGSQAGRKAMGLLGSVKRVFTGTGQVDVGNRVAHYESPGASPVKDQPQMSEIPQRSTSASATFWHGKQGKRDWEDGALPETSGNIGPSGIVRRKALPGQENEDDWDPEEAVQNRVVQVMFTVPKEKLRVVNVDNLSLLSKSDVDFEGGENEGESGKEIKRMSSVIEKEEDTIGQAVTTDTPPLPQQDVLDVPKRSDKGKEVMRKAVGSPSRRVFSPKYIFDE